MKKFFIALQLALIALLITNCQDNTKDNFLAQEEEEKVSGAYEALNFLGNRTVYPGTSIPENAFMDAWKLQERMPSVESNGRNEEPWETMGPVNRGGRTLTVELNPLNPNTLWIGTASGGIWRSYTQGLGATAWEYVPTGFPVLGVSTIAFPPADSMTMYIGTGEVYNYQAAGTGAAYRETRGSYGMGILKSTDGGESWEISLDWSYDQNRGIWSIKINPLNPEVIYAATTHGIYKSTDAGENWEEKLDVIMGTDLVVHPTDTNLVVAAAGNLGSPGRGIYRSEDGGENWVNITENLPSTFQGKIQLNYAPSDPNILYASIGNGFSFQDGASWLCKSFDFGATWQVINQTDYSIFQGWFAHDVGVSAGNPDDLVVVGITAWRSTDGGSSIVEETSGGIGDANPDPGDNSPRDQVHSDCHDVTFHPTDPMTVYVASDGGVHRSTDGGQTYQFVNGGLQNCQFYNGFSNSQQNSSFCLGGLQDNGTISWNGDDTWTVFSGGDGSFSGINPQDDNIFYVSSQRLNVNRFSPDFGFEFMEIPIVSSPVFIAPYVICPADGDIIYAGHGGISKTDTGGDLWFNTNDGQLLDNGNPVLSIGVANNPDVVYAATAPTTLFGGTRGNMFVTLNGGDSWQEQTGNLPDRYPMDIAADPTDEATAYVVFSGFGSGHVYKTTDYGSNWIDVSNGLPDIPTNAVVVDPLYPNQVYVGNDLGVYVSVDGGDNWETFQDGLNTATMIFDLTISPSNRKLRAATHGNGAYQRDLLDEVSSTTEAARSVAAMKLYPQPAANSVTLDLELTKAQKLSFELVDASGKTILRKEAGEYPAGVHRIPFSWSAVPAGTYYLQLRGNGFLKTEKLVIVE
jgi:photosystem II stability/assembly factor-like uncharacterized protein